MINNSDTKDEKEEFKSKDTIYQDLYRKKHAYIRIHHWKHFLYYFELLSAGLITNKKNKSFTLIFTYLFFSLVIKSCLTLATPWTVACQAPLSMGFSRQEYWSGCHFLLKGIFLTQESNPGPLHCRQILYQLSYEGSPSLLMSSLKLILSLSEIWVSELYYSFFSKELLLTFHSRQVY